MKRKANDELGGSQTGSQAETCLTADGKGKVDKKMMKTSADETKFCQADVPDFGYTSAANVNDAAQQAELRLYVSDYKAVNNMRLPHLVQRGPNGETTEEFVVRNYRINPSFRADTFQP